MLVTGCAKNEVKPAVQYVPTYIYLDACEPVPSRPTLNPLAAKHIGSVQNEANLDAMLDPIMTYVVKLESIVKCYEAQVKQEISHEGQK